MHYTFDSTPYPMIGSLYLTSQPANMRGDGRGGRICGMGGKGEMNADGCRYRCKCTYGDADKCIQ
jgi:hypothetical protein